MSPTWPLALAVIGLGEGEGKTGEQTMAALGGTGRPHPGLALRLAEAGGLASVVSGPASGRWWPAVAGAVRMIGSDAMCRARPGAPGHDKDNDAGPAGDLGSDPAGNTGGDGD